MARRMSNKDRIQKKAAEAKAKEKEKASKKKAKTTTKKAKKAPAKRTKKAPVPVRMKIVWAVCSPTGKILKTYLYPKKKDAEAEAKRLTKTKKGEHKVRPEKVPMED